MNRHCVHRIGRDGVLFLLLLVYPVTQVVITRSLPSVMAVSLLIILLVTVLGETSQARRVFAARHYSSAGQVALASLLALAVYTAISGFWAPDHRDALRESAMLLSLLIVPPIFYYTLRRTITLDAPKAAMTGAVLGSVIVLLEVRGVTSLHDWLAPKSELYDLTRYTSWLALGLFALASYGLCGQVRWAWVVPAVGLGLAAVFLARGQSAQLAVITGTVAAGLVYWKRGLAVLVFAAMAFALITAPFWLQFVPPPEHLPTGGVFNAAHIHHRVATWKGYAAALDAVPWYGLGANADERLGTTASVVSDALRASGYDPHTRSPHTILLEWRVNLGLVGVFLLGGASVAAGFAIAQLYRVRAAAFTYVFVAAFTIASTATEFFQGWWIAAIIMGVTLAALVCKPALKPGYPDRASKFVAAGEIPD